MGTEREDSSAPSCGCGAKFKIWAESGDCMEEPPEERSRGANVSLKMLSCIANFHKK